MCTEIRSSHSRNADVRNLFAGARPAIDGIIIAKMASLADHVKADHWRSTIASDAHTLAEMASAIRRLKIPGLSISDRHLIAAAVIM